MASGGKRKRRALMRISRNHHLILTSDFFHLNIVALFVNRRGAYFIYVMGKRREDKIGKIIIHSILTSLVLRTPDKPGIFSLPIPEYVEAREPGAFMVPLLHVIHVRWASASLFPIVFSSVRHVPT